MDIIEIDFIFLDDIKYTKDLIEQIDEMYKKGLLFSICVNNSIVLSDQEISKIEAEYLLGIVNTDKGFDDFINEGIKTEMAEYHPCK